MRIVIFGGAGFVGLNIAERFLADGHHVTLLDRNPVPDAARAAFAHHPGRFEAMQGDVTDRASIARAISHGTDALILGAAITAGSARDAAEPETILQVNLMAQVPAIARARDMGVRRVINLSSAAAYGTIGATAAELVEDGPVDPVGLYAITKYASEKVGARLAGLWNIDLVSVRLSGIFGPWEHATGLRDTLSPFFQVMELAAGSGTALLARPGTRDWTYAPDVADAVSRLVQAPALAHRLYNISNPALFSVLDWGRALAALRPGFDCRLAGAGETANIDLHAAIDRAPLSTMRLKTDLGWQATFDMARAVAHLNDWSLRQSGKVAAS